MQPTFLASRREFGITTESDTEIVVYTNYERVTQGLAAVFKIDCSSEVELSVTMNISQAILRDGQLMTTYAARPVNEVRPSSLTKDAITFSEDITPGKYLLSLGKQTPKLVTVSETTRDIAYDETLAEAIVQSFTDKDLSLQQVKYPFNQVVQARLHEGENMISVPSELVEQLRIMDGVELQSFVLRLTTNTQTDIKVVYDVVPQQAN